MFRVACEHLARILYHKLPVVPRLLVHRQSVRWSHTRDVRLNNLYHIRIIFIIFI